MNLSRLITIILCLQLPSRYKRWLLFIVLWQLVNQTTRNPTLASGAKLNLGSNRKRSGYGYTLLRYHFDFVHPSRYLIINRAQPQLPACVVICHQTGSLRCAS
jgi:hypothetical protein